MNSLPIEVDVEDSATLEEYLESLYVEEKHCIVANRRRINCRRESICLELREYLS